MKSRVHILEALPVQLWPVMDGVAHHPTVDEIKRLVVRPIVLNIIDFEADVRGNPARLDGAQVVSENLHPSTKRVTNRRNPMPNGLTSALGYLSPKIRRILGEATRRWKDERTNLYGPYASTGANIENTLWVFRDRCKVELASKGDFGHLVHDIQTLGLLLAWRKSPRVWVTRPSICYLVVWIDVAWPVV